MQIPVSNVFIKEETTKELILISPNRRWLALIGTLLAVSPLLLAGFSVATGERDQIVGLVMMLIAISILLFVLFFIAFRSQVFVHSDTRQIILLREYWLGVGALGRKREKSWGFEDVTNIYISSAGLTKRVDVEINGKKDFVLGFSLRKKEDAQRFYDVIQSWKKGLMPDSIEAAETLDKIKDKKTVTDALRSVEKMLYFFGVINLLSGGMNLMTANLTKTHNIMADIDFFTPAIISIVTGLVYLACGYGARKRSEISLWIAMLVVIAERLYAFVMAKSLDSEWGFSTIFVWIIAFFLLNTLWGGIQNIRRIEENRTFEPPL